MNIFSNRWVQLILIILVILGLFWVAGLNFNVNIGASGFQIGVNKT